MNYGIWYEAWQACCRYHNIKWQEEEDDECRKQASESFYVKNPAPDTRSEK